MRLEDLDRLRELAGIKVDEGRMSDMVIHDSETMSKEEFAKKHGKEMADEYFESAELTEEQFDEAAGEKDACYHKVKSRYKVWPSAYASGALVKCRKVGAKNWGKSKD